jgi:hyaluronan synthase
MVNVKYKFIIHFILILVLIIPIILQYIYKWNITFYINKNIIYISTYGIYLFVYLIIQFLFSFINNYLKYNLLETNNTNQSVNIIVVGYKENPILFTNCLESIKSTFLNSYIINKIYIIIDGNDSDDHYMVDIYNSVFSDIGNNSCISIDINDKTENFMEYLELINQYKIVCISKKHNGKRNAMYTGFQFSFLEKNIYNKNIQTIFCTDSDTIVHEECVQKMYNCFTDPKVGAVTGNLSIYNQYDSIISFLTSIRYWYAFNLERAYQSANGYVMCVSGPIGMYRIDLLEKVCEEWHNQTFLGKKCSYGDDRHLTNKILSLGSQIIYTPSAHSQTETPNTIYRFYKQQIRWNKSSFREFFWTIKYIPNYSLFISIDLIYTLFYPFIISGYLLYILYTGNLFELSFYLTIVLFIGLIKSLYSILLCKNFEHIFYSIYSIIYITTVFPAKLWALLSLNDNSWGTSNRKILSYNIGLDLSMLILWNSSLGCGFFYCIWNNSNNFYDLLYLIIISSVWSVLTISMYIYTKIKKTNTSSINFNVKLKNI